VAASLTQLDLDASATQLRQPPSVVINLGMGADSAAILLRYLTDPSSRDFDWTDAVVITAMTGDEFEQTGRDVEEHLLPLLRRHGVRYVQVARAQRHVTKAGDGIVVLSDTTHPTRVYLDGVYKLSDEMLEAGTLAQRAGSRLCSVHAKGDVLDPVIARLTEGRPYRQIIGYGANEPKRAANDRDHNTQLRIGVYPLLDWGWTRAMCIEFIASVTGGVIWEKSACAACPFALSNKAGLARVLARYASEPAAGIATLFQEHVALSLNPAQTLLPGRSARAVVTDEGLSHVLAGLDAKLASTEHAIYEVRRILRPRRHDRTKMANAARSVAAIATGTREQLRAQLAELAEQLGRDLATDEHGIDRVYLRTRASLFPTVEHFYVVCPAVVKDKHAPRFDEHWDALVPDDATPLAAATPPATQSQGAALRYRAQPLFEDR
jgi:hypothetical protein